VRFFEDLSSLLSSPIFLKNKIIHHKKKKISLESGPMRSSNSPEDRVFFPGIETKMYSSPKIQFAELERNTFAKWGGEYNKMILRAEDGNYYISDIGEYSEDLKLIHLPIGIPEGSGSVSVFKLYPDDSEPVDFRLYDRDAPHTLTVTLLLNGTVSTWNLTEKGTESRGSVVPSLLRDPEGRVVRDAQTVVTARSYFLTLTRSGHLYYNHQHYMENVQSIAAVDQTGFAVIMNPEHEYGYYCMFEVHPFKSTIPNVNQGSYGGRRDIRLPLVVNEPIFLLNTLGYAFLGRDGKVEMGSRGRSVPDVKCKDIPDELSKHLRDNYVKSLVASTHHFAALVELTDGSQGFHIWGENLCFSSFTDSEPEYLDPCFYKSEGIKVNRRGNVERKRKHIVSIVASNLDFDYGYGKVPDVFAINFEDNTSYLLSTSIPFSRSFPDHVQALHSTADGLLVLTRSKNVNRIWILYTAGETLTYEISAPISFATTGQGFVLIYPDGRPQFSNKSHIEDEQFERIDKAGGIAEIYSSGSRFIAILKDGTVTMLNPRRKSLAFMYGDWRKRDMTKGL
jgi:hypothetical protein